MAAAVTTGAPDRDESSLLANGLRAVRGVGRTLGSTGTGLVLDAASGLARAAELITDRAAGRRPGPGTLRVGVLICSDEHGPLTSPAAIAPALAAADAAFSAGAGIRVRITGINTVTEPAPLAALDARANQRLLLDDVLGRTDFYRRHLPPGSGNAVGAPVTVVVVRAIDGRTVGCSLGISANWVIVEASVFDGTAADRYDNTVLAHELGHALNLPHHRDLENLMFPASSPPATLRGTGLRRWQAAVIEANRHVVPGRVTVGAGARAADIAGRRAERAERTERTERTASERR